LIPEKELNFRSLPLSSKPFQIKFKNGVVSPERSPFH
jgi:hypothetical protein